MGEVADSLYWIDTGWGCGGVTTKHDVIITTPPIFYKLKGRNINHIAKTYKVQFVCTINEEDTMMDFF